MASASKITSLTAGIGSKLGHLRFANNTSNVIGVGIAASEGFKRAKARGGSSADAGKASLKEAAIPAFSAVGRPLLAPVAKAAAKQSDKLATAAARSYMVSASTAAKLGFVAAHSTTKALGFALKGITLASRAAPLVAPIVGAAQGMAKDTNKLRGAFRGAINSYDPSSLVMDRSISEKAFDSLFGEAELPQLTLKEVVKRKVKVVSHKARGWANPKVQHAAQIARKRKLA